MRLHPAGWGAWLVAVSVFAFTASNPLYLLTAIGALIVVHLAGEASETQNAVRGFVVLGAALLFVRLLFVALLPNPGATTLFVVPRVSLPVWLGSLTLGGPVTAEVLAAGVTDGLRLVVVLVGFAVFNERVDAAEWIRAVPPTLREIGLTVSIAAAFVPGTLKTARDISDAQRMRGERRRRLAVVSMAVGVMAMSIDRAFLLAESMDSRGYGCLGSPQWRRPWMMSALALQVGALGAWVGGMRVAASVLGVGGFVAMIGALRSTGPSTTRLRRRRPGRADLLVAVASLVGAAGSFSASARWEAYPEITLPAFEVWTVSAIALFTLPALLEVLTHERSAP